MEIRVNNLFKIKAFSVERISWICFVHTNSTKKDPQDMRGRIGGNLLSLCQISNFSNATLSSKTPTPKLPHHPDPPAVVAL